MRLGDDWWSGDGGGDYTPPDLPPDLPDWPDAPPPESAPPVYERPPPQDYPDVYAPPEPQTSDAGMVRSPDSYQAPQAFTDAGPGDPVEEAIHAFYQQGGGTTQGADGAAMRARSGEDNEILRNAQHALVTQQAIEEYGVVVGGAMALVAVPAYSIAKWVAQNVPGAAAVLQPFSSDPLTREGGASAPSFSEVWWGLRPLWAPLK